jgi:hypothetical protein
MRLGIAPIAKWNVLSARLAGNTSSVFTRAALGEKPLWEEPQSSRIVAAQSGGGAMPKHIAPYAC